eukprot:367076-Amphidinium_carterae.1
MMFPSETEKDTSFFFSGEELPVMAVDEDTLGAIDTAEPTDTLVSAVSSTADVLPPPDPVAPRPTKRRPNSFTSVLHTCAEEEDHDADCRGSAQGDQREAATSRIRSRG